MASISSPGIGSGLDINGIISKLMSVESRPLTQFATKEASFQAKLTAFGTLKGALSSLQTAALALTKTDTFTGMSASSSDGTLFSASASSSASTGNYDLAVTTIAKAHSLRTHVDYGSSTFDSGTLRIQIGSGTAVDINISSASTLSQVSQAINDAKAGVKATVINDGTADRMVLTSETTGIAGAITLTAPTSNSDGDLRLDNLIGIDDPDTAPSEGFLRETQAATDAKFSLNGVTITRSSNTIDDAVAGVTIKLLKEPASQTDPITPITGKLTVSQNTGAVTSAVSTFVKAYNDAITAIKNSTTYDVANKKAAILTGDGTARTIQSQLFGLAGTGVTGIAGGISRLSDVGITVQKDGTLSLDSSKLTTALADPDKNVAGLFTQTTNGNEGIAVRFNKLLDGVVGSSGLIASRSDGINASIKDLQKRADSFSLRLESIEKRYRAQFTALDTLVASMNQTSSYLAQQLANLPKA
jgi:flagellar hook-associated protein 2